MSKKPAGDRAALIKWRLEEMNRFAQVIKNSKWDESKAAQEDKYIRILGESCRAVSLNDKTPLCGFRDTGSKVVPTVIQHFAIGQPEDLSNEVWELKKERRLQSWIIKDALMHGRDLLQSPIFQCLKAGGVFDKLVFALDEVSFGDNKHPHPDAVVKVVGKKRISSPPKIVRCDLLAVGMKDGEIFPVVIELKTSRDRERLIDQLRNAEREISSHKREISSLMEMVTGMTVTAFDVKKILVWPKGDESKKTTERRVKFEELGGYFVEYEKEDFGHPEELKATLKRGG